MKIHLKSEESENKAICGAKSRPDTFVYNELGFTSHYATEYKCKKCETILNKKVNADK